MTMLSKTELIILAVGLPLAFALGRYSVSSPEIRTTENIQTSIQKKEDKDTHTQTVIMVIKQPDGTTKTIKTINTDTVSKTDVTKDSNTQIKQDAIPQKKDTLNISALMSYGVFKGDYTPTYGLSISKEVLGPVTAGIFGMTNGTLGLSVGINF